jgi:hypothetical protein
VVGVVLINMEAFYSQITMDQTLGTAYFGGPQNLILYFIFFVFSHIAIDVKNKFMCEIWNK